MHEKEISSQRKELFEKFAFQMKSPLNDIAGLADIAINTVSDEEKTKERLKLITDKTNEPFYMVHFFKQHFKQHLSKMIDF